MLMRERLQLINEKQMICDAFTFFSHQRRGEIRFVIYPTTSGSSSLIVSYCDASFRLVLDVARVILYTTRQQVIMIKLKNNMKWKQN